MLNKTCKQILAVSFALVALMASALPVAAQNSYYAVYSPTGAYSLRMENDSGSSIYQVYLSPAGSPYWGPDRLGSRIWHSGEAFTLGQISPGTYDLMFVDRKGNACVLNDRSIRSNKDVELTFTWFVNNCDDFE